MKILTMGSIILLLKTPVCWAELPYVFYAEGLESSPKQFNYNGCTKSLNRAKEICKSRGGSCHTYGRQEKLSPTGESSKIVLTYEVGPSCSEMNYLDGKDDFFKDGNVYLYKSKSFCFCSSSKPSEADYFAAFKNTIPESRDIDADKFRGTVAPTGKKVDTATD